MSNKPYGRQLKETGKVTICGNYGKGILKHEELGAEPEFAPGYTLRIIGEVSFVPAEVIIERAKRNR